MRPEQPCRLFAYLLLSCATRWAFAEAPLGATRVTIEADDAPVRQVFEGLAKQTGVPAESYPAGMWDAPDKRVSLSLQGVTFWRAARELGLRTGITPHGTEGRLVLRNDFAEWARRPAVEHGPILLTLRGLDSDRTIDLGAKPVQAQSCRLWFNADLEPKLRGLYWTTIRVTSCTDDKGRPIPAAAPDGHWQGGFHDGTANFPVDLKPPGDAARIKRVAGLAVLCVQAESETLTVPDLPRPGVREFPCAGLIVRVSNVTAAERGLDLHIDVRDPREDPAQWAATERWVRQLRPRVVDADGVVLAPDSGQGNRGAAYEYRLRLAYRRDKPRAAAGAAKLVWEMQTKVRDVDVPFNFQDLPLQ